MFATYEEFARFSKEFRSSTWTKTTLGLLRAHQGRHRRMVMWEAERQESQRQVAAPSVNGGTTLTNGEKFTNAFVARYRSNG